MKEKFDQFKVDPYRLVEELEDQPMLHRQYCEEATDANHRHEMAKYHRDVVEASLDHQIRTDPSKYGIDKVTERSIELTIRRQPEWQKAAREVIDAKHEMDRARSDVDASDQRRKMIEVSASLLLAGWYADRPIKAQGAMDRRAADERTERLHGPAKKFRPRPE